MGAPRIISEEQEKEAIKIALEGGDPLRYLEECGSNIPPQTWYRIKQKLKDTDPETYVKLPKRIQRKDTVKKQVETPEGEYSAAEAMEGMKNAADEFFGKCKDMGLRIETPEKPKVPNIYMPVRFDGKEVCGLKGDYGRYSVYELSGARYLNFVSNNGEELDMPVQAWRDFLKDMRKCAGIMGVEL